jgi:AbrB family looped-hinge helix DNA binding protein
VNETTNKEECCNKEYCKIDAVVSIDAKGQIVLPKDLREKANINPNDKLAIIGFQRNEKVLHSHAQARHAQKQPQKYAWPSF